MKGNVIQSLFVQYCGKYLELNRTLSSKNTGFNVHIVAKMQSLLLHIVAKIQSLLVYIAAKLKISILNLVATF